MWEKDMRLTIGKTYAISSEVIWWLMTDTRLWPLWGPSVRAVDCSDAVINSASTGRILTALGFWISFAVGDFVPGIYWDWRVAGVPATGHRVKPLGPGRCRLSFDTPAWAVAYLPVCYLALMRIQRLAKQMQRQGAS